MTPFDFVTSVSYTKQNLLEDDETAIKIYVPFIVNKALSYFPDALLYANEMNKNAHLDPKLQYHFYLNILRKARRFSKWAKTQVSQDLAAVQQFYGFNVEKAKQALAILTPEQVQHIRSKIAARGEQNDSTGKHG